MSLLKLYRQRANEPQSNTSAPEVFSDGEETWEVEKILDKRRRGQQIEYLVQWKGWDETYNQWVDESGCAGAKNALAEFESQHNRMKTSGKRRKYGHRP